MHILAERDKCESFAGKQETPKYPLRNFCGLCLDLASGAVATRSK